jgi:hypothetical protein
VLQELALALQRHTLSAAFLKRVVTAREQDEDRPFLTLQARAGMPCRWGPMTAVGMPAERATVGLLLQAAEQYAEHTTATVLYLTLEALGVQNPAADHCASHVVSRCWDTQRPAPVGRLALALT